MNKHAALQYALKRKLTWFENKKYAFVICYSFSDLFYLQSSWVTLLTLIDLVILWISEFNNMHFLSLFRAQVFLSIRTSLCFCDNFLGFKIISFQGHHGQCHCVKTGFLLHTDIHVSESLAYSGISAVCLPPSRNFDIRHSIYCVKKCQSLWHVLSVFDTEGSS